ncbi:hypothetical protein PYCC9005_004726 [Savitreella phatthalungensis]
MSHNRKTVRRLWTSLRFDERTAIARAERAGRQPSSVTETERRNVWLFSQVPSTLKGMFYRRLQEEIPLLRRCVNDWEPCLLLRKYLQNRTNDKRPSRQQSIQRRRSGSQQDATLAAAPAAGSEVESEQEVANSPGGPQSERPSVIDPVILTVTEQQRSTEPSSLTTLNEGQQSTIQIPSPVSPTMLRQSIPLDSMRPTDADTPVLRIDSLYRDNPAAPTEEEPDAYPQSESEPDARYQTPGLTGTPNEVPQPAPSTPQISSARRRRLPEEVSHHVTRIASCY